MDTRPTDTNDLQKYQFIPETYEDGTADHYCYMRALAKARGSAIDPAIDHAMKKLAWAGSRGVKDMVRDWEEAILSIQQAIRATRK